MADTQAVVFDLDGTLIDSAGDLMGAANLTLADLGLLPIDRETTIGFIGRGVPTLVRRFLAFRGAALDEAGIAAAISRFHDHYRPIETATTLPYPGVPAMLAALAARGIRLGICTNKGEAGARSICETLGIARFFPVIVGGDTLSARKPDPAPLRRAIQRLGAEPALTLYVGDSETDWLTAQAAGIRFGYFEGGYQRTPIDGLAPEVRLAAMADLADLI